MHAQERIGALAIAGGAALSVLTLVAYWKLAGDEAVSPPRRIPNAERTAVEPVATPASPAAAVAPIPRTATAVPAALVRAPTRLSLEAYELTPATFAAWRDYLVGEPAGRLWERIAWRTTLWDAIVDSHEQGKPILLEVHGGNALGHC
jgi:hypothetical protein